MELISVKDGDEQFWQCLQCNWTAEGFDLKAVDTSQPEMDRLQNDADRWLGSKVSAGFLEEDVVKVGIAKGVARLERLRLFRDVKTFKKILGTQYQQLFKLNKYWEYCRESGCQFNREGFKRWQVAQKPKGADHGDHQGPGDKQLPNRGSTGLQGHGTRREDQD